MAYLKAPLSFLRPLRLPRSSTITCFFNTRQSLTTESTPKRQIEKVNPPRVIPLIHLVEPSTPIASATSLTYRVLRTKTNSLPVYLDHKRGGNLKLTRIRKVEGDPQALMADLLKALDLSQEKRILNNKKARLEKRGMNIGKEPLIWVNQLTGHVVIRGHHKSEVEKFLMSCPF